MPTLHAIDLSKLNHRPYRLLKFVLLFAMFWTVGTPTAAFAAPAPQLGTLTDQAVLLAYYESDIIAPNNDEEGILQLSFYDDDTFMMVAITVDEEEIGTAYGTYEVTDDGVVLTVTGADGEDEDEPVIIEMEWGADDTLLIPAGGDTAFEEDILLHPVVLDNGAELGGIVDDPANIPTFPIVGVYVSSVQPYENSDGVVYLLNLLPSGDASLNSDYLDLEAPIYEIGTWTDNGDGTVTVEITESLDEVYDDPILIEFEIGEYGELKLATFSLYPLDILNYLDDDTLAAEDTQSGDDGSGESDVYIYVAEIIPPGDEEPLYIYMFLHDDGEVVMTDADELITLYGEWVFEDDLLSVSLTHDDEGAFDEPGDLIFEFNDEDALVAIYYPVEVFGEDELIFYPANNSEEVSATEGEFYFYESDQLPNSETPGTIISVALSGEGDVVVSTDLMSDDEPYFEFGEWALDREGNIVITITESQDEVYDEPFVLTFAENDDLSLTLIDESVEIFGDFVLVLHRIE